MNHPSLSRKELTQAAREVLFPRAMLEELVSSIVGVPLVWQFRPSHIPIVVEIPQREIAITLQFDTPESRAAQSGDLDPMAICDMLNNNLIETASQKRIMGQSEKWFQTTLGDSPTRKMDQLIFSRSDHATYSIHELLSHLKNVYDITQGTSRPLIVHLRQMQAFQGEHPGLRPF